MNEAAVNRLRTLWPWLRVVFNLVVCAVILAGAYAAVIWINRTEPVAQKVNSTRRSSALVETTTVRRGTFAPRLVVLGTVQAAQRIRLRPRVSGQVIEVSPEFVPGGMIDQGDLLLRIDPADFENALSIRRSELEQAEASMEIEKARQQLAEKELKLLEGSIDDTNRSLVMREPQIASIEAEVSAANAAIDRAQLDLDRTKIYTPFDAQVLSRSANIGSQVGPSDELGQLVGLDEYWIIATVPVRSLRWVQFPDEGMPEDSLAFNTDGSNIDRPVQTASAADDCEKGANASSGSRVILRNPDAWGDDVTRQARVSKLIGSLDQQTRLARVLITVPDPLGRQSGSPPLILDTLLETEIEGKPIEDVIRLNRAYVRNQDTVWVMKNEKLEIRETEIVFRDAEYAYINQGLEDGDEVVISTLATVAPGVGLRKIVTASQDEDSGQATVSRVSE